MKRTTTLPHTPERVWRALTESKALGRWFLPASTNIGVASGQRFTFTNADGERIACTLIAAEPNRRLSFTWQAGSDDVSSSVTWTLKPVQDGTQVELVHDARAFPSDGMMSLSACLGTIGTSSKPRQRHRGRTKRTLRPPHCLTPLPARQFRQKEILSWR